MEATNPALKDIEFLVGAWEVELSNGAFLPDPQQTISSSVNYQWKADGSVIAMQQTNHEIKAAPESATWIIGRDESADEYTVLYADSRGVSRVYRMTFQNNLWKMWRDNPKFAQRFTAKVSPDHQTIHAEWQSSTDGGHTWHHDFDMLYKRA